MATAVLLVAAGCVGAVGDAPHVQDSPLPPPASVACAESKTDEVRLLLEPSCVGCHGQSSNKPFFVSLAAFENLLVRNPVYVKPGNPDESLLVRVLEGTGDGLFKQMPPSGETFSTLAKAGKTHIDVAAVRSWIATLEALPPNEAPDLSTESTRRLTAEELTATLMDQIGLVFEDDFVQGYGQNHGSPTIQLTGDIGVYSPDASPPPESSDNREARFLALGGPGWIARRPRDQSISPPFLQTLVQLSQAWCRMAVLKEGNEVFFAKAQRDATSATSAGPIRDNIAYLYLRMLGEAPSDDDVARVFDEIFVRYEPEGSDVAWTAVCASFVRHPLWLSF
jgi:hypothetical protein